MLIEVKVPQLSESVAEATLLGWHKQIGEAVARDENLIDIETDKIVMELPAPAAGVLVDIKKLEGALVVSGEVIAILDNEAKVSAQPAAIAPKVSEKPQIPAVAGPSPGAAPVMPAARKILADHAVDPVVVAGTGKGGRITKEDALTHLSGLVTPPASPAKQKVVLDQPKVTVTQGNRPEQRVPMTRLRARVAERLVQSQSTAAILTTFNEVNMLPVIELRNRYKERFEKEYGIKLGFMSFFVKAAVAGLKKYPVVNASVDGNDIVYHGYFDIGIAVGSARGLVVPILRDADKLSIADLERKIAEFGTRAKEGKITLEELTGGTFSISNGGVFGSMLSTPIINPPQAAILGIHATKERAVVENGQIVIRPINYLALSYDHRIIDGREAVLMLVAIKEAMEDPARLLLDI